jgi:putative salt-induced outer membrane protein YdiY
MRSIWLPCAEKWRQRSSESFCQKGTQEVFASTKKSLHVSHFRSRGAAAGNSAAIRASLRQVALSCPVGGHERRNGAAKNKNGAQVKTRMARARILVICSLLVLSAGTALADEVILTNGDRLTGTILRKEHDTLVFTTTYGGDLNIRWVEVTGILSDKPQRFYLDDGRRLTGTASPGSDGEITIEAEREPSIGPIPLSLVRWINPSPEVAGEGTEFKGRLNLGAASTAGNTDTEKFHIDAEIIARTFKNRYTAGAAGNEGKTSGVKSESDWLAYLKYDRFLTPKWYAYVNGSAEQDRFKDIDLRTTAGAGSGYQFIDTDRTNLSLEGGLSNVRTDFAATPDEDYTALRWALKFEHTLFKSEVQFFHQHEALLAVDDPEKIVVKSITGLRMPIVKKIRTALQYNLDWENEPAPGRVRTDRALLLTLGYEF